MDTPDENTTAATTRPLFGNKMALAAVENTQADAEAAAETTDVGNEAAVASTEVTEDTTLSADAGLPAEEPVEDTRLVDAVNEEALHEAADDPELPVEVDRTTIENLPSDPLPVEHDQTNEVIDTDTAVTEAVEDAPVDTATEGEHPVAGEVEADQADLAEAQTETEAALAGAAPVEAEVEQDAETDTSAEETVQVEPEAPATEDGKSVEELQAERQKLDDEIKSKVDAQKASVIAQIKTVAETYGITADELAEAMGGLKSKRKGVPAKPKYRDPATGVIWSGRGKEPAWIKGQDRTKFAI